MDDKAGSISIGQGEGAEIDLIEAADRLMAYQDRGAREVKTIKRTRK